MTSGQLRAIRELERLQAAAPDAVELLEPPALVDGFVQLVVSIRVGPFERRAGGLDLRDREQFVVFVSPDFPFSPPSLRVGHSRFHGFPHVTWGTALCLYQSKLEWNPADGLFGFFDRLNLWLERAAKNDMDPVEGPLEPPHYATDFSQVSVVVRADAPALPGQLWIGWADLHKSENRTELVGWRAFGTPKPTGQSVAPAIMLPEAIPMEFPTHGGALFAEFLKQGVDRDLLLQLLGLASLVTPNGEPLHLVVGLPMRRAADGSIRLHIAVWTTDTDYGSSIRQACPNAEDSDELRDLRKDLADAIFALFDKSPIKWCNILEDRPEVIARRDALTPMAWFHGKRVLLLGCGALGSWAGEFIVRAGCKSIHLVDNAVVKPGLLIRQNFTLDEIGRNKALALGRRLATIRNDLQIESITTDATDFVKGDADRLGSYDLVLDCTASAVVHMKLELAWTSLRRNLRSLASIIIDAHAQRCLAISLGPESPEGPWSAFLRLKSRLCLEDRRPEFVTAFYSDRAAHALFQPEPGCSDPTFVGSAADVSRLAGSALNLVAGHRPNKGSRAFAFTASDAAGLPASDIVELSPVHEVLAGAYRVLLTAKALNQARSFVRQNARLRSRSHETGGLLWGYWDDAAGVIVVLDASGPPPDSRHEPAHFSCGVQGTLEESSHRRERSQGVCCFLGMWHTHPDLPPLQSSEDIAGMSGLVAAAGQNQRRALMVIFGGTVGRPGAGVYIYESHAPKRSGWESIQVGRAQVVLESSVT